MSIAGFIISMGLLSIFAAILGQMVGIKNLIKNMFQKLMEESGL